MSDFINDSNSGWEDVDGILTILDETEERDTFRKMCEDMPSRSLLNMKESVREQIWLGTRKGASLTRIKEYEEKVSIIDKVLSQRPKFTVMVEKLSYEASERNLPSVRIVDLYIDTLEEEGFSIAIELDGKNPRPLITSKDKLDRILNEVFYWGQNDHQSKECPSVSVGDVIHIIGKYFRVASIGFEPLTVPDYADYREVDARDRSCFDTWRERIKK